MTKDNQNKGGGSKGGGSKGGGSKGSGHGGGRPKGGGSKGGGSKGGGSKGGGSKGGGNRGNGSKGGGKSGGARGNGQSLAPRPPSRGNLSLGVGNFGNTIKRTAVGVGGGLTSRILADISVGLGINYAPQLTFLRHGAIRPGVTFVLGGFATPYIFRMFGADRQSQEDARTGSFIAAGFDLLDNLIPDVRGRIVSKLPYVGPLAVGAGQQDAALVETNVRTALPPADNAVVQQAAQAGAEAGASQALGALGYLGGDADADDYADDDDDSDDDF